MRHRSRTDAHASLRSSYLPADLDLHRFVDIVEVVDEDAEIAAGDVFDDLTKPVRRNGRFGGALEPPPATSASALPCTTRGIPTVPPPLAPTSIFPVMSIFSVLLTGPPSRPKPLAIDHLPT